LTRMAQRDAEGALADLDQALALTPRSDAAMLYHDRGAVRVLQADWAAAIADYDHALEIYPRFTVAYISRGNARYHERDPLAVTDYLRAFRLNASIAAREIVRILAEDLIRDARGVFENCSNHLRSNPEDPVARVRRGLSLLFIKRNEDAKADLESAGADVPEFRAHWDFIVRAALQYEANRTRTSDPTP